MQPVLPSFDLPEKIEAGKATLISFCAVNDLTEDFPNTTCEWRLLKEKDDIASATFPVDIPANGVSAQIKLTLPSLRSGRYTLSVSLISGDKTLAENHYELKVDDLE
jgi:hypothetical protein